MTDDLRPPAPPRAPLPDVSWRHAPRRGRRSTHLWIVAHLWLLAQVQQLGGVEHDAAPMPARARNGPSQAGQSTVEYALVLLGAAAVALALVAWVTRSDAVSRLFDAIVGRILSQAG